MQQGYYSAAWSDIKNSPGWFGRICLMGLLSAIPVFGAMVCYGYSYGWARDIAWNVHRPMPNRLLGNEDGKLYYRGICAFLIFGAAGLVSGIPSFVLGDSSLGVLVVVAISLFLSVFACIGAMRMAIYARLSAGFQLKKMWTMMSHDFNGFLRIVGMTALLSLIFFAAFCIAICIPILIFMLIAVLAAGADLGALLYAGTYPIDAGNANAIASGFVLFAVLMIVVCYAASCVSCWISLVQARAMGYWVRQFDVASWRGQNDPMPFEAVRSAAAAVQVQQPVPSSFGCAACEGAAGAPSGQGESADMRNVPLATQGDSAAGQEEPDALKWNSAGPAVQLDEAAEPAEGGIDAQDAPVLVWDGAGVDQDGVDGEPTGSFDAEAGRTCASCGAKVSGAAKFCSHCGSALQS